MPSLLTRASRLRASVPPVPARRWKIALVVALVADAVQLGLVPLFGEGVFSAPDDVLDVLVAVVLLVTLGPRLRLAGALAIELVPGATLLPTWTAVVLSLPRERSRALHAPTRTPA